MKAITILQPWASLIACGAKQIETRSWATQYRGLIAIHAGLSQKFYVFQQEEPFASALEQHSKVVDIGGAVEIEYEDRIELEYGKVIAIANLVDCREIVHFYTLAPTVPQAKRAILDNGYTVSGNEIEFGDYTQGRYAWILKDIQAIKPVPAKGMQRLWNWAGEVVAK
ncbi:ASCH domain-containing protein [Pelosinus propionicus]|uniref:ASCH domain-containing protein n=1 Tax=Pelosinus propionicus DSM 13327 TaxID=1123291 RepID=A0A1I4N2S8_9FIRM|nr:ASCH domain-containing protein [Pelosinus propionicus]SFM09617.1 ASCH domain-containing protein [Pelosinus propionicus DSM 13327]